MLDERQSQVRDHTHGPLLVLAVAGSGKTTSVIHRAAHRVGDGVPPDEMLLLTFSRKAAAEMRDRLGGLLDTVSGRSAATGTGAKEYRQRDVRMTVYHTLPGLFSRCEAGLGSCDQAQRRGFHALS
ncbi:UvrD-helicase domain-containing protein [Alkalispirillum mobile]|uniref:UvrD-helicase domain-containing protein n=1 Tax=Alkalispirillum mobile TaxID=85925 RepID=UPI000EAD0FE0|nr:UvrD-helicase domain-containing protein [Alkalispirillum mobile]